VRGIAQNKLRESRRRGRVEDRARRRLALAPEVLDDADLARVDELASAGAHALALMDRLPKRQRLALRSRVLEGRGYAEIARELECSELVVRQQVSRGLRRLRDELTEGER
jgi:RNA polymerase sigma-70 factor (ECF subfamily)